ncbi:MAG: hypothetical protein V1750_05440, partial [Acidobacteriota bacterium]
MRINEVPRWMVFVAVVVTALALIPLAMIARARTTTSVTPRFNLVPDMDQQPKLKTQQANPMF